LSPARESRRNLTQPLEPFWPIRAQHGLWLHLCQVTDGHKVA
jgi:hypothetical protein